MGTAASMSHQSALQLFRMQTGGFQYVGVSYFGADQFLGYPILGCPC